VAVAIDPDAKPSDLATPGHVFPLRARDGGVLVRAGHTEAATDIARLAGMNPAGVICEIMNDDGTMARLPDLVAFGQKHALKIGTISDLIAYRRRHDNLVKEKSVRRVTSAHGGDWLMRIFADDTHGDEHIVLTKGDLAGDAPVLVRVHNLNPLEDVLGISEGHSSDIHGAMRVIAEAGRGVVVLLRDTSMKMVLEGEVSPQTLRQYGLGAQILAALGLTKITLVTNSAAPRVVALEAYGLNITGTKAITE
jgi:3,4-dihydroxy 2-butanone 4-phosphate synthase/GTP cyclohydrolase II